jgi:asparagine synthase (glutamine-hydrolysing)
VCGIAGVLDLAGNPASPVTVRAMTETLRHRGPDGEGYFTDGPVGLGHTRLAIIDPSPAGHQPMITPDGRFVLNYNGEVYNFQELRLELESLGWRFRSRTDTEVVLYSLAQWGLDALLRFNGLFALALWDRDARELLLARDRFGIKPLYVARGAGQLLFGSEVKALLAHPGLSAQLDPEALAEYLAFQNLFTARTLFQGVQLLPPASFLRVGGASGNDSLEPEQYWDFEFTEERPERSLRAAADELDSLFQQAVSRQLVADVPVGSYLSGGIDSGAITALASRQLGGMCTFTIGFDMNTVSGVEVGFDEREEAEYLSYVCETEHYEMVLKAGDMERSMERLMWHLEDPRVGQSYPNFYGARLASKFGQVVLSGAGGDELFGGYPWRYYRGVVNRDFDDYIDKYFKFWQRMLTTDRWRQILKPVRSDVSGVSPREIFRKVFPTDRELPRSPEDYVNSSLYFEAKTFLPGLLLVEDKLSMAHSLETRVPFLDNDLVDFAQRLPVSLKLANLGEIARLNENELGAKVERFMDNNRDGKLILRETMKRYMPEHVTQGAKQGFSAPDATWFRGPSIDYVRRRLLGKDACVYDYLERSVIHDLVTEHIEGKKNRRLLIWSLLCLEQWCRTFLVNEVPRR